MIWDFWCFVMPSLNMEWRTTLQVSNNPPMSITEKSQQLQHSQ